MFCTLLLFANKRKQKEEEKDLASELSESVLCLLVCHKSELHMLVMLALWIPDLLMTFHTLKYPAD